jgi:hypothetical protein
MCPVLDAKEPAPREGKIRRREKMVVPSPNKNAAMYRSLELAFMKTEKTKNIVENKTPII